MAEKFTTQLNFEDGAYTIKDPNAINKYTNSADDGQIQGQGDVTGILNFSNGIRMFGIEDVTQETETETIHFGNISEARETEPSYKLILIDEDSYKKIENVEKYALYCIVRGD